MSTPRIRIAQPVALFFPALVLAAAGTLAAQAPVHPAPAPHAAGAAHEAAPERRGAARGLAGHNVHTAGLANVRPANVPLPDSNRTFLPSPLPRALAMPLAPFWEGRDIMREIQAIARRGFIAVTPVASTTPAVTDFAFVPAGWKPYAFAVPGKESLHVRLHHGNEGWFRLAMVNRWGQLSEGMLQNRIPTGNPEVSFKNPSNLPQVVYVIVDDPGWMSSETNPYVLNIDRSWDPLKHAMPDVPAALGIWATRQPKADPKATPEPAPAPVPAKS